MDKQNAWRSSLIPSQAELDRLGESMAQRGIIPKHLMILDLQHQLFLLTTDFKLHLAPIRPRPEWVLDIGTGTGIWYV